MLCVNPLSISVKGTAQLITVPCGQCVACKVNRAREWEFRLVAESGFWPDSAFLTLTYVDPEIISVDRVHLQLAFKRARKSGLKFKYYAAAEYGGQTKRPHYHVCLFYQGDLGFTPDLSYGRGNGHLSWWSHGIVNLGTFTAQSARYTADYLLKELGDPPPLFCAPTFRLISLGLGKRYFEQLGLQGAEVSIPYKGSFISVPRYYRKMMVDPTNKWGVSERVLRFISRDRQGVRGQELRFERAMQRKRDLISRQRLYKKEF